MITIKILFWIFFFVVFYAYVGYGILLFIYLKIFGSKHQRFTSIDIPDEQLPEVTLVVALYNEEDIVERKILNTLQLRYPQQKLKFLFITDGSTDRTNDIIGKYPQITLLFEPRRTGKVAAINRAMKFVTTPITVFCDANTFLNDTAILELVKHFQEPKIGAVAGEKKVVQEMAAGEDGMYAAGAGEGLYWRYESFLKRKDSEFYTVVGAAGELFAVRTALYYHVDTEVLLDDFIISMKICQEGYRVVYEPNAYAMEAPSFDIKEEQKRKIRISAGGIQSILMLKPLLNIFKYGKLSFQYISHRVLRWIVCPFLLPLLLLINIFIVVKAPSLLYQIILFLQVGFYLAALEGWWFAQRNIKVKSLYIPYYFVFMNVSVFLGMKRF